MELRTRIEALSEAARAAGFEAATEAQVGYVIALMDRKAITAALFNGQKMLTKKGASNLITQIPKMNRGLV